MYEGELYKKNNKLIPIVYQSIYSFAPYDKYLLSKFFIINTLSSFDIIYKTNLYIMYNKIAKMFLDWLIDINLNKNEYEEKYKKQISSGLFFIRLTTNLFDTSVISKELYYELKYLNLYIYLCNIFIYLLDPYHINVISNKLKIEINNKSKDYIIYDYLKKIYVVKNETFEFVSNVIQNQEIVMTQEILENKKIYEKKYRNYKNIVYLKAELSHLDSIDDFRFAFKYGPTPSIINKFSYEKNIEYEYYEAIEYVSYKINKEESTKIYNKVKSNLYADFVYKKSQVTEIMHTNDYLIFYYENKRVLMEYEYYNFFTPIKVYPNKYYAFMYYGRPNQYNNDIDFLIVVYNELLSILGLPYFYCDTQDYDEFFIQLIGFISLNIEIPFEQYLDKKKIIDLYYDKESEYLLAKLD